MPTRTRRYPWSLARDDAADLDDFAAESLMARVHQAIWDAPKP